jgi:hypothetical protein
LASGFIRGRSRLGPAPLLARPKDALGRANGAGGADVPGVWDGTGGWKRKGWFLGGRPDPLALNSVLRGDAVCGTILAGGAGWALPESGGYWTAPSISAALPFSGRRSEADNAGERKKKDAVDEEPTPNALTARSDRARLVEPGWPQRPGKESLENPPAGNPGVLPIPFGTTIRSKYGRGIEPRT